MTTIAPNAGLIANALNGSATLVPNQQHEASPIAQTPAARPETESERIGRTLVLRIAAGDSSAETQLVERYQRGLIFVLQRECGDAELARDIAQDTLTKVIINARESRIQRPGALSCYIRQTGIYQLIDFKRKQKRRRTSPSTDTVAEAPAPDAGIPDRLESKDMANFVRQILEELPIERDRELLRRFYLIGQDKALIAAEFNVTSAHFDRVKYRALRRMRELITEQMTQRGADVNDWF